MPVAFENLMIRGSAIHIAYRIFAAFFIDMGAKTSIVENLDLFNLNSFIVLLSKFRYNNKVIIMFQLIISSVFVNDPSAGSPTETLLRLLLPLGDMVYLFFHLRSPKGSPNHPVSVGATGGVYKGQGHNQCKMMTCTY